MSDLWHDPASTIFENYSGHLRVMVCWDLSLVREGDLAMVREVVEYRRQDPGIFDWNPPNPTINRPYTSGLACRAPDVHIMPVPRNPLRAGQWEAFQRYQYTLNEAERNSNHWREMSPTYRIVRQIYQEGGNWFYRITKRSSAFELYRNELNLNFVVRLHPTGTVLRYNQAISRAG
jgi:hypothetical protein